MKNVSGLWAIAIACAPTAGCGGLVADIGGAPDGGQSSAGHSDGATGAAASSQGDSSSVSPSGSSGGPSGGSDTGSSGGSASSSGGSAPATPSGGSGSSSGNASSSGTSMPYDGTVGKSCQNDADCLSQGGPELAVCSNSIITNFVSPATRCILPTCDPVGSGNGAVQFCDGAPTDSLSPGVCVPTTQVPHVGMGVCMPQCRFGRDGRAPSGCIGKDICHYAGVAVTTSGERIGAGYCSGWCTSDGDCPSGSHCQVDQGICLRTLYTRTKTLGQACDASDTASGACYCDTATAAAGICTRFCAVGDVACPTGYVCDSGETNTLAGPGDAGATLWIPHQNMGMAGVCRVDCSASNDAGSDGGACPPGLRCNAGESAGPVCTP